MTVVEPTHDRAPCWILPLDEAACWARLARGSEGRLKVHTGRGACAVVTGYRPSMAGPVMGVVLAIPQYSSILSYTYGRRITLEVDGQDDDGGAWVVRLTGLARALDNPCGHAGKADPVDAVEQPVRWIYLPGDHVGGSVRHPCVGPTGGRHD